MKEIVKIVVHVPEDNSNKVRDAIGTAGGGKIGNYEYCSFSVKGTGRFLPQLGANPTIGSVGTPEEVIEERIEITCDKTDALRIVNAIKNAHPYEEPTIDIYPLLSHESL